MPAAVPPASRAAPPSVSGSQPSEEDSAEQTQPRRERKKGTPWTEAEHRGFLLALQSGLRGQWREIARHYVPTRTSTQVASHAQKHFIRQQDGKRKRRSSLFDLQVPEFDAMDSATSAKRRHVQAAAPPAELPLPAPAADPFALQHLLAAHPAALLQAQAGGLAGPLPLVHLPALAYAGYPAGLPGVGGGLDALLAGQALLPQFPFGAPFGLGAQQAAAALLFAQQQQARAALLVAAAAGVGPAAFGAGHAVFGPDYGPAACAEQAAAVPEAAPASPAGSESAPAAPHAGSPGCGWGYAARHAAAGGAKAAKLGSPGGGSAGDAGGDAGGDASGSDDTFGHGRLYRPSARFAPAVPPPAPAAARGSPPPELLRSGSGPGAAPASASVATSAATTATTVHF